MLFGRQLVGALGASSWAARWSPPRSHALRLARGGSVSMSTTATTTTTTTTTGTPTPKLAALRAELARLGLDAFVIPTDDPHLSEYVADHYTRREFASGFTGSAGTAVVTATEALLWTDGRYWLQAEQELSEEWTLMRQGEKGVPTVADWVVTKTDAAKADIVVGIDASCTSASLAKLLREAAAAAKAPEGVVVRVDRVASNPVDAVWGAERPAKPRSPLRVHPLDYAGETAASKVARVRGALREEEGAPRALVVAALDDVCWLLNIRGADIMCNPVGFAYAVVTLDEAWLFVDEEKVTPQVRAALDEAGVGVAAYDACVAYVEALDKESKVWLDPDRVSDAFVAAVQPEARQISKRSPIALMKALKNDAELRGMEAAHTRDGAAAARGFAEIEEAVVTASLEAVIDEVTVDEILTRYRAQDPKFLELSFPTIAGAGANGAIIHYGAARPTAATLGREMLLVDSGGQYLDGTTDVTRTMHFGTPSALETTAFTNVLKGNIAVDTAVFPEETPGFVLDAFARRALWRSGQDYAHGTGHGVGAALNVHEGPHSISPRWGNLEPLRAGMVVSNEPGFYARGKFGVRLENLLQIRYADDDDHHQADQGKKRFLKFEKLTHIPFDRTAIDPTLLDAAEVEWLDAYHAQVWEKISPLVADCERTTKWLARMCRPLLKEEKNAPAVSA